MKIQGGRLRGKTVEARQDRSLRPTKSFIREAMFNLLKHGKFLYDDNFVADDNPSRVVDRNVVDIFCGTGILGLEALSHGATHTTFVDQSHDTMKLVRSNVAALKLEENSKCVRSDSTNLPRATMQHDLVFMDPPYGKDLARKALRSLKEQGWLADGAVIVLEQGKHDEVADLPADFTLLSDRNYDKTRLSILQFKL